MGILPFTQISPNSTLSTGLNRERVLGHFYYFIEAIVFIYPLEVSGTAHQTEAPTSTVEMSSIR
jgi:hypothetical protein